MQNFFLFSYYGYIEKRSGDGWLNVRLDSGPIVSLPEYLRVYVSQEGEREGLKILEGPYRKETASAKRKGWRVDDFLGSYFDVEEHTKEGCPHKGPAELILYQKSNKLKISGVGEFSTNMDINNLIPEGIYDLEMPDIPHQFGLYYTEMAPHAKTWFRIGHDGNRYLRCGQHSQGSIGVKEVNKWESIYNHLIVSRKGWDSVGTIKIINS